MLSIGTISRSSFASRRIGSGVISRTRTTLATQQQQHLVPPHGLYIERLANEDKHIQTSEEKAISGGPSSEEIAYVFVLSLLLSCGCSVF